MRGDLEQFMKWLDVYHRIEAFMNADTLKNAREARAHSALGIGLTCTEPMLIISAQLIAAVRRLIRAVMLNTPAQQEDMLFRRDLFAVDGLQWIS
ncbi:hypothetical protein PF002_g30038 [Phytophthora fragariae]|uniref:PEP-utilising enzyme C-terminal domain-containing protein n=1 Tax=Phytophthora fragariae TaxID=53985 RepID=A0A6A3VSR2_9STRA|nr:hypothetical protein PF003_g3078 [Phytophthora fragariae]KAE8913561.1 hypothetical protein PF003_g2590 [Phytophthora fragariae]KAE9170618.1 hypothetical protein PF002_g30038 [Phytophthora fragariae]